MSTYQLYFREPSSGRVLARRALPSCDDDQVALVEMARMADTNDIELWDHGRLVAVLRATRSGRRMEAGVTGLWQRLKDWLAGTPVRGMA
jgi:hypothetical protein